jgi:NAD(P)-dependent dehydrogenase (short-subunit alcohol dehydrogenase family)
MKSLLIAYFDKHSILEYILEDNMAESEKKTVVITGANQGIGFEVVRQLITQHSNWTIWLGARSRLKGLEAIKKLNNNNVHLLELDV